MERTGKIISISKWLDSKSPGRKFKKFSLANDDGEFEFRLWEQDEDALAAIATSYDEDRLCQVEASKNTAGYIQVDKVILVTDVEEEIEPPEPKREQKPTVPTTGAYLAPPTTKDEAIAHAVAIKEIGECWRAGKLADGDMLVLAYIEWLRGQMNVTAAPKKPPTIKNKQDKDPAKASKEQIESIRRLLAGELNIDLDEVDMTAATISYLKDERLTERDLSYEEAGEWIKKLQP